MLSSPAPSHTASRVLHNRTNALPTLAKRHSQSPAKSYKRPATEAEVGRRKRAKVSDEEERGDLIEHSEDSDFEEERDSEDDTCTSPPNTTQSISCRRSYLNTRGTAASTHRLGATEVCTRPILQSFVSSHKSDVFRCTANAAGLDLTPPYACSFSYGAKRGGDAVLAVATEEGSVHILNTNPRSDWDYEPQRTTLQPHENGVFGIKWSPTDALLATCSGDQSTRITHVKKEQITHILRGHTSTVKCIAWEPGRDDLLATGGRDGTICLWDLRLASSQETEDAPVVDPVLTILGAHESVKIVGKPRPRRRKSVPAPKSITNLLYPEANPYALISSSSFDGVLRCWDLRQPSSSTKKPRSTKPRMPPVTCTPDDPTMSHGSRRPRGIIGLAAGAGPTEGLLFALGADSRIHAYSTLSLAHLPINFSHTQLQASSFSIGLAVSPCGRWLASGSTGLKGSCFLFDVEHAARPFSTSGPGILVQAQRGDICAVDWAHNSLATCADDGTVRLWRPNLDAYRDCQAKPGEKQWDWCWSTDSS